MLKPEGEIQFKLDDFKRNMQICGIFFNILTNLNKFVGYEQRDPFMIKNELNQHPDYTEWDRFAANEYLRLAMEEENAENVRHSIMNHYDLLSMSHFEIIIAK
jgi:serine/threonine-protein phosphatase 2A regulatory subunit B''